MQKKPLLAVLLTVSLLILAGIGSYALGRNISPSVDFSTSYRDFPDPLPMPTDEPAKMVDVRGLIEAFDISADGGTIAIATSTDLILYDLQTLKEIHSLPLHEQAFQVKFSPDGRKLAVSAINLKDLSSGNLHVAVWDTISWNILYEYESESQDVIPEGGLAWSPNGKQLAFSVPERGLSVVDVESGNEVASLDDFITPPFDLSWSPDGLRLIATGDLGYGLRRWRVDTNQWVRLWDKRLQPARRVVWSPDGKRIASGAFGGEVCVWDAGNNQCKGFIDAHFNSVNALDWSPDGTRLATASGAIRIWDPETGELMSGFGFYDGLIYDELRWFNADAIATLETSYTENLPSMIRLWDVASGDVKLAFRGWDNIQSQSAGGVTLVLDDVQTSDERSIIHVSLIFDTPQHSVAGQWSVTMTDSQGRLYPLKDITPETMDSSLSRVFETVPLPLGEQIVLNLASFPLQRGMPLMLDFSGNPGKFTFDPSQLQIGESVKLDDEIQAGFYTLHLVSAQKTPNILTFNFDAERTYTGVTLSAASATDSSAELVENDTIASSLTFPEMPNEPIEIEVKKIFYNAYGSWDLTFRVVASMFVGGIPVP
ncbi:MAG: PD40 domain-containing protein [Anaerolineales bacterium]|nr:PD40 domain-containing protein [Anaerolineales bacterium]